MSGTQTITLRPGDTLSGLSQRYHVSVADLRVANHMAPGATHIEAGDRFIIASPAQANTKPQSTSKSTTEAPSSELEDRFESVVDSMRLSGIIRDDEHTAWVVYDLKTNEKHVSINEDRPMLAASMVKPFVALAFFTEVNAGRQEYNDRAKLNMEWMIQHSSNACTNWFIDKLGGPKAVQQILKENYPGVCQQVSIVEKIPEGGATYRNKCSAHDYSRLLYALWHDQVPHSDELQRVMELPGRDRIVCGAPGVPEGTGVCNKTGSTARTCGDMGIVMGEDADGSEHPYIFVGIIEKDERTDYYSKWVKRRGDAIRKLSGAAYEYVMTA